MVGAQPAEGTEEGSIRTCERLCYERATNQISRRLWGDSSKRDLSMNARDALPHSLQRLHIHECPSMLQQQTVSPMSPLPGNMVQTHQKKQRAERPRVWIAHTSRPPLLPPTSAQATQTLHRHRARHVRRGGPLDHHRRARGAHLRDGGEDGEDDEPDEDDPPEPRERHHGGEDAAGGELRAEREVRPDALCAGEGKADGRMGGGRREYSDGQAIMSRLRRYGEREGRGRTVETTQPTSQSSQSTESPPSSTRFLEAVEATKLGTHPFLPAKPYESVHRRVHQNGRALTQAVWCRGS